MQTPRIVFLDYLRIFAFVSVLVGHKFQEQVTQLGHDASVPALVRALAQMVFPLIQGGGAGVVVFFLVSGYIIVHVLQTERGGEFLVKRALRIYPLYIVAVLVQYVLLRQSGEAPSGTVLLQQLLLVGDLFGTPYALGYVEWTLRVEMAFYLCMAALRAAGMVTGPRYALPLACFALALVCRGLAPIPAGGPLPGCLTIYGPFLLLGTMTYLLEHRRVHTALYLVFVVLVFLSYYALITRLQPQWIGAHFAAWGYLLFLAALAVRHHLPQSGVVLFLSDLTFAVYLFHNWLFDVAKRHVGTDLLALAVLLVWCAVMVRLVEKPSIRWGRRLSGV